MNNQKIAIVILSAGASSRLGKPKQLMQMINGKTLLENTLYVANEARGCGYLLLITGAYHEEFAHIWKAFEVEVIHNKKWKDGMSSSMAEAISYIDKKDVHGVIFLVSDQPFLDTAQLKSVMDKIAECPDNIIVSKYQEGAGPPVYFPRAFFSAIKSLTGDQGAKTIIKANADIVQFVSFPKGNIDIDTAENYRDYLDAAG